ncbi:hypothetical protein QBC34DRAFT_434796 [Podospora aff. communis PSN243]|uniref:VLRF1 domain-containing protein n=1 Tax=Podospora aff. communis PSN243 TaxID=3040156 RepID=A0AAV9GZX4_9PEZI|nr:hypothetical protein QBC34DRAFT_434796 [Podospora aff. communis PSN243]
MEKKQEEQLRRPLYLYGLPRDVLNSLSLKADAGLSTQQELQSTPSTSRDQSPGPPTPNTTAVGSQACSLCSLVFIAVQEQRDHLKTDLHLYNLKLKRNGLTPVTEAQFEKLVGDLDESISGSDSSDTEDYEDETSSRKDTTLAALLRKQATLADKRNPGDEEEPGSRRKQGDGKPPLLWFESPKLPEKTYYGIYRALFTPEELDKEDAIIEAIKQRQLAPVSMPKLPKDGSAVPAGYKGRHIFLCMIGGGHFAAMVVSLAPKQSKHSAGPLNREAIVLAHKTFHRYTTRRKQGGSQSANDNAKGAAHSAGASIRRYNEQALVEDVRELLKDWKTPIDTSDLLFIRATGSTNRRTLFGPYDGQVLRANDPRIRGFPFSTRRATQNELMRSFIELTRLKVKEIEPVALPTPESTTTTQPSQPKPPTKPKLTEEEELALLHTTQIQAMIRRSKLPALLTYLKTNSLDAAAFRFQPADAQQNHHAPTALHLAASQNSAPLITGLLTRAGADPTILNGEGKPPFELAGDRATRDAFRVARAELGDKAWDWEAAKVPAALKREEAEQRAERERKEKEGKEAERRKAEEERLKKEGPKVKVGGAARPGAGILGNTVPKTAQERREEEARGLTPEQRMRLDRERRARAAEERFKRMQGAG